MPSFAKLLLFCLVVYGTPIFAEPHTFEYKLENGLKLIVREDHRAPTVITQIWYRVGSSAEPNGLTGISHALEHMMFKGTTRHPGDEFSRLIAIGGGDQNAFTYRDFTTYYQEIPVDRLNLCLELEADRMMNLNLQAKDFEQEIKVVREERRLRTEDQPEALSFERLMAAAYISNPYHHPIVGWMNDLNYLNIEDLRQWYKSWYGPNNATIVVVGNIQAAAVFEMVKTHFAPLAPITLPLLKPRLECPPLGKRQVEVVSTKASVPHLLIAYNVPSLATASDPTEPYALTVLSMALSQGQSSRLKQRLVRNQSLATQLSGWYSAFEKHESLLVLSAAPVGTHTLDELENGFLKEIADLQNNLLGPEELDRVKMNAIAQQVFDRDAMSNQAIALGMLDSVGLPWQLTDEFPNKIKAISAEEVQKVAKKYLQSRRLTIARLIPSVEP